ncbi:MAG: cadherin-like beta sandwich domain-containing protein, partial [Clostridia bacterium]|nr:cadherin-like beta sandwich domain-containing protein [Clostridia bacterium]
AGETISVTATVKNNTDVIYAAQISVNFDTAYFEYSGFEASTEVLKSRLDPNQSDTANGLAVIFVEDDEKGISASQWKMGTVKLKVKSGVTLPAGSSSAITCTDSLLGGVDEVEHTVNGESISIKFAAPSTACELTELKVNNQTLTSTGRSYTCTVPYSYTSLNSGFSVKVSAGAKYTVSKTALDVGSNSVTITVTAEDGVTSQTYTLNATRTAGETVKTLSSLIFENNGTAILTKSAADLGSAATFDVGEIAFADKDKLSVGFTKNGNFSTVDVKLDGTKVGNTTPAGTATAKYSFSNVSAGSHTVTVEVKPEDGSSSNEYKITFNVVAAEQSATLSALSLKIVKAGGDEAVNFAESFAPTTTTYSATVPQGTAKVKVEATAAGEFATIDGVREYVKEYNVPCSITITVRSQSGAETPYTIVVSIAKDTSGLTLTNVSAVGLKKEGNNVLNEHSLNIAETSVADYFIISIPFTMDITHFKIKADEFSGDGYRVEGTNYDIDINRASTTKHLVRFIKNNIVEKTITYDVIYESNVKTLSKLTYGGTEVDLSTGLNYFFVEVTKETATIEIVPTTTDPYASATVISILSDSSTPAAGTRTVTLAGGINPILISVKATNGDEGTYVLCIMRPLGSQLLTKLECDGKDLFDGSDVNDNTSIYSHSVSADKATVIINAAAIEGATVEIYNSEM